MLIGVTADSVKDLFFTPHSGTSGEHQTPGVVVHAHIVSQLLRAAIEWERPIGSLSERMELLWLLVWTMAGALCALRFRTLWVFATVTTAGVIAIILAALGAFYANTWIPLVPPVLGWLTATIGTSAYVSPIERLERRNLMSLFSKHVSPQLAHAIWAQRDQFLSHNRPRPQRLTATAFFSDIASFTTISEALDPGTLMDWLNEYMALMSPRINEHDGVILRFIGDAIMAVFGVPVARATEADIRRDAINAVRCALVMQDYLKAHNRDLAERGLPLVGMRIGILTGPMVAGTIGSDERLEYNVHGDTVNTAARLEGFEKENFTPDHYETPCRILVGGETANHLTDEFELRRVGNVDLRGKTQPVAIFEVLWARGTRQ